MGRTVGMKESIEDKKPLKNKEVEKETIDTPKEKTPKKEG